MFAGISDLVFHLSNYTLIYQLVTSVFPKKNVHVVDGDLLVEKPMNEIRKVETFLGLPHYFNTSHFTYPKHKKGFPCFMLGGVGKCMARDKGRDHPLLKNETLNFLLTKFQPMIEKFKEQTGVYLKNTKDKLKRKSNQTTSQQEPGEENHPAE